METIVADFLKTVDGSGSGFGSGSGDGSGDGSGYGDGDGDGVKAFCGKPVYEIDGVPTLISHVKGNVAKGHILNRDLTLTPCYVAKANGMFAHGGTLREAVGALEEKLFLGLCAEERCEAFMKEFEPGKEYPAAAFFEWHNKLSGSCEMGRRAFARERNIDIDKDRLTVERFIDLTRDAYGGDTIKMLEEMWKERHGGKGEKQ